jgi:hypothetical protein
MTSVMQWIPTGGRHPESWRSVECYMNTHLPANVEEIEFKTSPAGSIDIWNKVVREFLKSEHEWLWSVHDDILYHPDTLVRLMSWNQPLVSALTFHRTNPALPHIWKVIKDGEQSICGQLVGDTKRWFMEKHEKWILPGPVVIEPRPDDALIEVTFTSTSCSLIHRSVLEALEEPMHGDWFMQKDKTTGGGEDRSFFEAAIEAGFTPYVDRSCVVGHCFGAQPTGVMDFILWETHPLYSDVEVFDDDN